jgi:GTPase SAR1 family protein
LSELGLEEIPEEVFELVWLEKLDVSASVWSEEQVRSIPANISQLTTLKNFACCFNQIDNLGPLATLNNLNSLSCGGNKISDLSPLATLNNLNSLDCSHNKISDLSPLENLNQLESICCSSNEISNLSPLANLNQLKLLICSYNQIIDLSPLVNLKQLDSLSCSSNQISDLPPIKNVVLSGQFIQFYLYDNPIGEIPSALLGRHRFESCQENLRNYWLDLAKGSAKQQQLKTQFIGNGRVGKTTLAHALEHKRAPDEPCKSTHGITIREIQQVLEGEDEPVTLQLWDFGGQEIYHATHRLFLSDDCLYLLLWAEDQQEKEANETNHSPAYWLELIHDLGANSPVILVKNQIDRSDHLPIRPAELTEDIPGVKQIRQEVKISAQQYRGMPALRGAIESVLEELKHRVCLELPTSWLQVQDELKQLEQKTIPFAHFKQICIKAGVNHAEWFADYLHKTGIVFYRKGAFQGQIILDQNWAINAVYRVFDPNKPHRRLIERMGGRFNGEDASLFWDDEETETTEREIYLDFMRNCGICYEPDRRETWQEQKPLKEREFIIPALLPLTSLAQSAWGETRPDDWQLDIAYPFLHRSIIERIILRLGETYAGEPWRSGIFCTTDTGQLLLECEYSNKQASTQGRLHFRLRGNQPDQLVYALRKLISEISPHRRYTEYLQKPAAERIELPEFKDEAMDHKSRLDDTQPADKTVKLFISYSHADEAHKEQLEKHLKAISRNLPLTVWDDRKRTLFAGEPVDEQIFQQLNTADIIVLLISPDFINSDYCFTKEMERALERYNDEGNVVIPIIIRHTASWRNHAIGKIVALPKDGKPLKKWDDADEFWGSVEDGIRAQVEKLANGT